MDKFSNILKTIDQDELSVSELVSILEMISTKIDINTISQMARNERKTPKGIRESNNYRKLKIGKQLMAVKGLKESNLPF